MLNEGQKAPDINLPSSDGKEFNLKDYKNKKNVVLYFYPKDDTPGCTVQACGFRDEIKMIEPRYGLLDRLLSLRVLSDEELEEVREFKKKCQQNCGSI